MKVVHFITRLILGGAQENTLLTVEDQHHLFQDDVTLITGPGLGPEGSLIERAQGGGLDVRIIPQLRRNIHLLRDASSYRDVVKLLKQIRPQIVHTHSTKAGIMGRAAAWELGIPVVHTIHGPAFHAQQSRLAYEFYRGLERWAAKGTDKLISVCDAMSEQYIAAGVAPREKFVTVYSGMEVEQFLNPARTREEVRRELGFQPDEIVIGKVARLFELKGHDDVIAAAKVIASKNPKVRFLFVGDGILRDTLKEQIRAAGLEGRFVFTGLVPSQKVPELIGAMDIVVHTSLREGLARVLPQGLISGKPVVSYDVDGAREVCITDETGFLIPPREIDQLATALLTLADSADLRLKMGETGRTRFTEQFRHENMTRHLREIYQQVIDTRTSPKR
ncbi:MAG: glycosyltransferase family 4 protein [Planctomycetales bacterium]